MSKGLWQSFMKSGNIKDYLKYRKSKDTKNRSSNGEIDGVKDRDNCKGSKV